MRIEVGGGLGNQLFQFSLGVYLKYKFPNINIEFDKTNYGLVDTHEGYVLDSFLPYSSSVGLNFKSVKYHSSASKKVFYFFARLSNKLILEDLPYKFSGDLFVDDNSILVGSWQSYKYVLGTPSLDIISRTLSSIHNELGAHKILPEFEGDTIAIHVRRGDYLLSVNSGYGILPMSYYLKAMDSQMRINSCRFLIFSDDYDFVKNNFNFSNCIIVDDLFGKGDSLRDLYLMSICDGLITANSSLSWWGGMLQKNSNIITPDRWFKDRCASDMVDFILPYWSTVEV